MPISLQIDTNIGFPQQVGHAWIFLGDGKWMDKFFFYEFIWKVEKWIYMWKLDKWVYLKSREMSVYVESRERRTIIDDY